MDAAPQFALILSGSEADIFAIGEKLGFEDEMKALSLSVFETELDSGVFECHAHFASTSDAEVARDMLDLGDDVSARIERLEDQDWVSITQAGLPPVEAGAYFIHGSHDASNIPDSAAYPILIDAGMAFGTGHHGTTKACLLMLDQLRNDGFIPGSILDLGAGAGILAIAAAKTYDAPILATDIDPDAVDVTIVNSQINGVASKIDAIVAPGFDHNALAGKSFNLIFANILAQPLMGLAPEIAEALNPNGYVILSGILDELVDDVAGAFEQVGIKTKAQPSLEGWTSLLGTITAPLP